MFILGHSIKKGHGKYTISYFTNFFSSSALRFPDILKEKKCKKVLFAGKVEKPKFSKLRLDLKGIYYIPSIIKSSKLGDAAILKEIIKIFKKENIKTVSSLFFNPELALKKGNYTKTKPNKHNQGN